MKKKKVARPALFIGSSKESLDHAYAIQKNLEDCAETTVWDQGVFRLTKSSVTNLVKAFDKSDFAVFVFAPDDALRLRKTIYNAVRDNVVFELGLSIGKLGAERSFMVVPKSSGSLRMPTDLAGITPGTFDSNRNDKNLRAAFGPFCHEVRDEIRRKGKRVRLGVVAPRRTTSGKTSSAAPPVDLHAHRSHTLGRGPAGDLLIVEARYGCRDHRFDVRDELIAKIKDGKLHMYVGNQLKGDPCPNVKKDLVVKYRYKNRELVKVVEETADLDLP